MPIKKEPQTGVDCPVPYWVVKDRLPHYCAGEDGRASEEEEDQRWGGFHQSVYDWLEETRRADGWRESNHQVHLLIQLRMNTQGGERLSSTLA